MRDNRPVSGDGSPGGTASAVRGSRADGSVARQVFLLQIVIVLALVVVATSVAYADERTRQRDEARQRSTDVALAVADAPSVRAALGTPDPSRTIQPYAEQVRRDTGTDFVVVMALDRTRYSHPDPHQIGKSFIGDLGDAPEGGVFTQEYAGTLGPSMRAVVPVWDDAHGRVVALVSVGITLERIDAVLRDRLLRIAAVGLLFLVLGAVGTALIGRRLRRLTHGLGAREITRMYEYYDSVLHAVHEGLMLLDRDQRLQLVNDEGRRLLGLPEDGLGRSLTELDLPEGLTRSLATGSAGPDEIHLVDDLVLVVNQAPAYWRGRHLGSVVTLRDHTELRAVSGELDTVKTLSESLHAQNHEAANRLHTVVSLIELGRADDALEFATAELESAQSLADAMSGAMSGSVADSVVPALLLGKSAQASERGIALVVDPATRVEEPFVRPGDLVTLVGNLLDNAFDALAEAPPGTTRRVDVAVVCDADGLRIDVGDNGPGLPPGTAERVFERGWSTKRGDTDSGIALGRGLGLALVGQVARRYGGRVYADTSPLGGAAFHVRIPRPMGERP